MTDIAKPLNDAAKNAKMSLLIIDDSDFIRDRLVALFDESKNLGKILQARDSFEALERFNAFMPEIVLLDIHIPGDNGIKILEKFKSIRPAAIVIMLTNYPYEQYKSRCMELGADYFFQKSGDMNEIFQLCENLSLNN